MPFRSKAQQRYMFANMPDVAERFASETPDIKKLPQHVPTKKPAPVRRRRPIP